VPNFYFFNMVALYRDSVMSLSMGSYTVSTLGLCGNV